MGFFLATGLGRLGKLIQGLRGSVYKYIRVRVVVNVDRPLRRILRVDITGDGVETTILLRYERLPDHCFRCGGLGHVVRDCIEEGDMRLREDHNLMFGSWLRASSPIRGGFSQSRKDGNKVSVERNGPKPPAKDRVGGQGTFGVSDRSRWDKGKASLMVRAMSLENHDTGRALGRRSEGGICNFRDQ
ncbi:hypothetical protein Ddye_017901 [Dipteronia dyeriana]|uniref:CCHC-type domain-containing protein n=1 Tax=Dipteronia dyeriana TaxID=168575 RepID=A0AAD9UAB3_9ROSI|nr:hypothetical protein Ddye_017901 [Dipteronia dyeriana]